MTALELVRQNPHLELAPILRVIKYMGLDSGSLSPEDVDRILKLYPHFEHDPELVVGREQVSQETGLDPDTLESVLRDRRREIPYLGTPSHPMVPRVALRMIRAIVDGEDPLAETEKRFYTLTEMAEKTHISLASLSKYVKEHGDRIPFEMVGKMRKFPAEAAEVFRQIKEENLGRRRGQLGEGPRVPSATRRAARRLAALREQLESNLTLARELVKALNRMSRQVGRLERALLPASAAPAAEQPTGGRRWAGDSHPDTIVAACRRVLEEADGPMRVAEITDRVLALGAEIRAKNPNVTVSSILSSYEDFRRVKRGYYELAS